MAAFREHITFSGLCGLGYGAGMYSLTPVSPVQAAVAGTLTCVAGMLPDLDSDHGRPIRELTALCAAALPALLARRFAQWTGEVDGVVFLSILTYVLVRYVGANLLRRVTIHRGMFHSLPAAIIAAEITYLSYVSPHVGVKMLMGTGVLLGFCSHLVLDELYSVTWRGLRPRLKSSAGTAVKWFGEYFFANAACYGLLIFLTYCTLVQGGLVEGMQVDHSRVAAGPDDLRSPATF